MTGAAVETYRRLNLDCLVCIGGGGTAKNALRLMQSGHNAGWLALSASLAGGADVCLIPEIPYRLDSVVEALRLRAESGRRFSLVSIAEGARPVKGTESSQRTPGSPRADEPVANSSVHRTAARGSARPRYPGHDPRPHPAQRDSHRDRSHPRHATRNDRRPPDPRRRLRRHGGRQGEGDRARAFGEGGRAKEDGPPRPPADRVGPFDRVVFGGLTRPAPRRRRASSE